MDLKCVTNYKERISLTESPTRTLPNDTLQNNEDENHTDTTIKISKTNSFKSKQSHSKNLMNILLQQIPEIDQYFNLHKKIGEGTFSNVFMATSKLLSDDKKFAIKHLLPTSHPSRILQELKCLKDIGGCNNVAGVEVCFRNRDVMAFVMPYFPHDSFADYVLDMSCDELKLYMKNLLIALQRVHSFNVVHRDVKPNNFLYNRKMRRFLLVDFGLSNSVEEYKKKTPLDMNRTVKKRDLDPIEKELYSNDRKRPVLHNLSTNIREKAANDCQDWKKMGNKSSIKKISPLYKENSPHSKKPSVYRDIRHVKRNLQFGNLTSEMKNEMKATISPPILSAQTTNSPLAVSNMKFQAKVPELTNFRLSLNKEGSSFFRLQNSQVKSRYSISGCTIGSNPLVGKSYTPSLFGVRKCGCEGKATICNACIVKKSMYAPRAGTPGYRSPEILLKYPHQTTAIDIWSAGVIMLSIMTRSYPFFHAADDITTLMEIISIFGTDVVKNTAKKLGRNVICSEHHKPLDLRKMCQQLYKRNGHVKSDDKTKMPSCDICHQLKIPNESCFCPDSKSCDKSEFIFPDSAFDLLSNLLSIDSDTRYSASQALEHPFLKGD